VLLVRQNVLLIVFDTARADAFEPYGAAAGCSPAVSQLAARGQAYEAFSAAPWTVPSHVSMFSGLLPQAAGIPGPDPENLLEGIRAALPPLRHRWLPAVMSAAGYRTAGISANVQVSPWTGFDMGFDRFEYVSPDRCTQMSDDSVRGRLRWSRQAIQARTDDGAAQVERLLADWLDEGPSREPFFWFANLIECHSPYLPPRPYNPLAPLGRYRAAQEARRYLTQMNLWRAAAGGFDITAEALDRMRLLYAASVHLADDWLARVLDGFDRHGLLDETIVIVTSDHGENLGEGDLIGHVFSVDDRLIRVPFIVSGPAAAVPGPRFSHVDLAAWLAASCGLPESPWPAAAGREVAVAQFTAPGDPGDPRAAAVADMWGLGELAVSRLTTSLQCATNGRRKLVRRGDRDELIDLDTDPLEVSPRTIGADEGRRSGAELTSLRAALEQAASQVAPAARAPAAAARPPAADDADLEARMRLLGYL
jgi:arylsulfatase A-like enzyme